jgi:hypothetical protein
MFRPTATFCRAQNKGKRTADEACLTYYKALRGRIPLMIMELCEAVIKRVSYADHCFELSSTRRSSRAPSTSRALSRLWPRRKKCTNGWRRSARPTVCAS